MKATCILCLSQTLDWLPDESCAKDKKCGGDYEASATAAGRVLVPSLFSRSPPSTFDLPVANCFLVAKGRMMKDTSFLFVLISKYLLRN